MSWRRLQFFFFGAILFVWSPGFSEPTIGHTYSLNLVDVDQNKLATADGHVTVLAIVSSTDVERARKVGDHVPEYCLANPEYHMVTILRFERKHHAPMRAIINALVRRRLDGEAQRLQTRYIAKKITRDARKDVFAVTDFDGTVGSQIGIPADSIAFQVLVLGRKGELLARWTDVPSPEQLAAVVK